MQQNTQNPINLWRAWPLYLVWLALIVYFGLSAWPNPLIAGPLGQDDALHLVQVRDLLAGQSWFDMVQQRLQPPQGLELHWSRLIDAPMAGLSFVFGERTMLFLWPSLLIGPFLFAALYSAKQLSPKIELLPVLFVSALCLVPLSYFAPARIDHHNVQMVLALILAGALARPLLTSQTALIAATSCALMMAIGLETLPYVVVGLAVIAIGWSLGFSNGKPVAIFGIAFAALTFLAWISQTNIQSQQAVCDMLSPVYVWPIVIGGLGLAIISYAGTNFSTVGRFGLLILTGVAALAVFAWINPECLGGPMAQVPMDLQEKWLKTVAEAQPISSILQSAPGLAVERYGPPLLALIIGAFLAWKNPIYRFGLFVFLALLAAACAVSIVQLRGALFAHSFTIAIFAFAIDLARKKYAANQKSIPAIVAMSLAFMACQSLFFLIVSSFVPWGQTQAAASNAATSKAIVKPPTELDRECAGQDVRDAVAKLGDTFVAAPVFFGAQVLEMGSASVLAGPYHRATGAIFDALKLFEDGTLAEQDALSRWKPDYLVLCLTSDDTASVVAKNPQSLSARLKMGHVPDWLKPLPMAGQLAIYAVQPKQ